MQRQSDQLKHHLQEECVLGNKLSWMTFHKSARDDDEPCQIGRQCIVVTFLCISTAPLGGSLFLLTKISWEMKGGIGGGAGPSILVASVLECMSVLKFQPLLL